MQTGGRRALHSARIPLTVLIEETIAYLDILHDHVDVGRRLYDLVQADDVRVHEQAQDLDLAPHCGGGARRGARTRTGGEARAGVAAGEGLGATPTRGLHAPL